MSTCPLRTYEMRKLILPVLALVQSIWRNLRAMSAPGKSSPSGRPGTSCKSSRRLLCLGDRLEFPVRQNLALVRFDQQHTLLALSNTVKFRVLAEVDGLELQCVVERGSFRSAAGWSFFSCRHGFPPSITVLPVASIRPARPPPPSAPAASRDGGRTRLPPCGGGPLAAPSRSAPPARPSPSRAAPAIRRAAS